MMGKFLRHSNYVVDRAAEAAAIPDLRKSLAALDDVFADCGRIASVYPGPCEVTLSLVSRAVEVWQSGRELLRSLDVCELKPKDYVYILRRDGSVLCAGRVKRIRPDGRYRVKKSGRNQVVTVPRGRLKEHPQNRW
jgi:hypothetical protein